MTFSQEILKWYSQNKRNMPWRQTTDPYKIWLSEIMLQQTRVAQGTPYYLKFIKNFPTIFDLANASEEKVLKLWQGLGYYSRARNLHATAKTVANEFEGNFPDTYNELLKLKGIGDYTASAIASICFNKPEPVVDGNVYRVLSRYFGIDKPINSTDGVKYFKKMAKRVMDGKNIRDYNQGIMEFGAIQCAPKTPYCLHCPLNIDCVAFQTNQIHNLPVKLSKTKVRNRYFNYLVPVTSNGRTILKQRLGKGIWQNLWEFPLLESPMPIDKDEVEGSLKDFPSLKDAIQVSRHNEVPIIHKLSHQHLHTVFWIIKLNSDLKESISIVELEKYPVPVLIANFLKTSKNSYF